MVLSASGAVLGFGAMKCELSPVSFVWCGLDEAVEEVEEMNAGRNTDSFRTGELEVDDGIFVAASDDSIARTS